MPTDVSGFTAHPIKHKLSLRASVTSDLVLDDVRLPASAALPGARGLRGPLSCLSEARYGIIWGAMGAARSAFRAALDYSLTRHQFGRPIAGFQLTQEKLAWMNQELAWAPCSHCTSAGWKDSSGLRPDQISTGKLNNVSKALEVSRTARVLGANGISLEYPVIQHMTNLESVLTYEGTSEIHTLTVGQALTGIAAFR